MKTCPICCENLPFDAFNKGKGWSDGLQIYCRSCQKKKKADWSAKNKDWQTEYSKKWKIQNPEKAKAGRDRRFAIAVKRYPEKRAARTAISNALRDGRLVKQPCWVCGDEKTQAHHVCYKDPYMISWLCSAHHKETHAMMDKLSA